MARINLQVEKTSYVGKVLGLIGKKHPHALLLKTRFGIHTFGVRFPIDVVILNKSNEIVTLKEHLLPNRIFFWNPSFDTVIELPEGTIKKYNLKITDKLLLTFHEDKKVL